MDDITLTHELIRGGLGSAAIRSAVSNQSLRRIRRGAYTCTNDAEADLAALHRQQIDATLRQGHPGAVVSHGSGAVVKGLGVPREAIRAVHLTRDRRGGGQRRNWLQVHGHPLPPDHVELVDHVAVTTLPRTVVDLGCTLSLPDAVAVGDGALRLGMTTGQLAKVLSDVGARRGIASARRAVELLDGRSESYGESVSRILMLEHGWPAPEPQLRVRDRAGHVVARVDFGWPELGVIGEFDGRVKYGRTLAPDQDPARAVWDEKVREDLLRDLGWEVVRWIWSDLDDPTGWFGRLGRAIARARSRAVA